MQGVAQQNRGMCFPTCIAPNGQRQRSSTHHEVVDLHAHDRTDGIGTAEGDEQTGWVVKGTQADGGGGDSGGGTESASSAPAHSTRCRFRGRRDFEGSMAGTQPGGEREAVPDVQVRALAGSKMQTQQEVIGAQS